MTDFEILEILISAERESAELMREAHGVMAECKTGRRDVVTEYDRRVQELMMLRIRENVPGAAFFCEESDRRDDINAEHMFIIDPIDGTMNFVHSLNHSCISAAYMSRGELRAAAIYNPYVDELFTAVKGQGAKLNGAPIHTADGSLSENLCVCGTAPYNMELLDRTFALMKAACTAALDIRRQGSAALDLCTAAAGRAGVYFELQTSLWDFAAGKLIVEEAGGICLDIDGNEMPLDGAKSSVLAGSHECVKEFLAIAKRIN